MDFTELKNFMDRLTAWRMPGNSICVYHNNKKIFSYSSGYADVENKIPMTGEEMLNIYSCSKPTTVTAALQLYEKGYFLLDDPLYEYIPEYRRMFVKDKSGNITEAKNPITMRHLFTMTAGLTYDRDTDGIKAAKAATGGRADTVTVAKYIARDPLAFEPGEVWNYSLCHDVLAAAVEVISGERFENYVKNHIFSPIGVENICYHRDEQTYEKMAQQYSYETDETLDSVEAQRRVVAEGGHLVNVGKGIGDFEFGSEYDSGGAGITVSVPDYAVFASTLANGGLAPNGERILSPGTVELMQTKQLTDAQMKGFTFESLTGYSYGLGVRTVDSRAVSGFTGERNEFGWGGAAGATLLADSDSHLAYFYSHHMLNPQEAYYQPRLRNVVYGCIGK